MGWDQLHVGLSAEVGEHKPRVKTDGLGRQAALSE